VRGEVRSAGLSDQDSVHTYLDVLAVLLTAEREPVPGRPDFATLWSDVRQAGAATLPLERIERIKSGFNQQITNLFGFEFRAALAVRHAACAFFQEAHFTFESSAQDDLFA
jgi:hypothetical protein